MKKIIPFIAAAALTLGGCASDGGTSSGGGTALTDKDAASAILAAEHETNRAKKFGYEWRDTGKMIKKAKAAQKGGDFAKAVKLANKAKRQSSNAIAQYNEQQNAGPRY